MQIPVQFLIKKSLILIMNYIKKDYKIYVIVNNSIGTENLQLYELKNISDNDVFKIIVENKVYLNSSIISKSSKLYSYTLDTNKIHELSKV